MKVVSMESEDNPSKLSRAAKSGFCFIMRWMRLTMNVAVMMSWSRLCEPSLPFQRSNVRSPRLTSLMMESSTGFLMCSADIHCRGMLGIPDTCGIE